MNLLDVKRLRKDLCLTQIQFSNEIGVQQSFLSRIENGLDPMPQYFIDKIKELYPNFNISEYLYPKSSSSIHNFKNSHNAKCKPIPIYELHSFSNVANLFSNNNQVPPIDYLIIPKLPVADGAMLMHGDSMSPMVKNGDLIVYKIVKNFPQSLVWGEMYILYFDFNTDKILTVRNIQKGSCNNSITLFSENKQYQDNEFSLNHLKAVALVKAIVNFRAII